MAFKMNRSIIKGTANHKASIAKAKQSIVAQTRTKADPSLTWAGEQLGKSYVPEAIDYTIDSPEIKVPEKKELTEEEKAALAAKKAKKAEEKATKKADKKAKKNAAEKYGVRKKDLIKNNDGNWVTKGMYLQEKKEKDRVHSAQKEFAERVEKEGPIDVDWSLTGRDFLNQSKSSTASSESESESEKESVFVPQEFKSNIAGDKFRYRYIGPTDATGKPDIEGSFDGLEFMDPNRPGKWITAGKTKEGTWKGYNTIQELYKKRRDADELFDSPVNKKSPYKNGKSPAEMRDDRIYRHAVKSGPVRKNMIKGGYIPPNER